MAKKKVLDKNGFFIGSKKQVQLLMKSVDTVMSAVHMMQTLHKMSGLQPEDSMTMIVMVTGQTIHEYCQREGVPSKEVIPLLCDCVQEYIKGAEKESNKKKN